MGKKILVVEDEKDIRELIVYNLAKNGYSAEGTGDGQDALKKIKTGRFDLVLLDLMLPGMDGIDLCRTLKSDQAFSATPVIMISARTEELDKVLGLEIGADDYITKPFSTRELMARVKAVLRRSPVRAEKKAEGLIKTGPFVIDTEKYVLTKRGSEIGLSAMEFKLLAYMAGRPGKVMSRDFLLDAAWTGEACVEPRTVDVHIRRLREKIEDDPSSPEYIMTKRGIGYYFRAGEKQ
jgi:DNA-binding response OmpR family regulator